MITIGKIPQKVKLFFKPIHTPVSAHVYAYYCSLVVALCVSRGVTIPLGSRLYVKKEHAKTVGLFNRGQREQTVAVNWSDLGINGEQTVRDLWCQKDLGTFTGQFEAAVGRHGVVLVKIAAEK